MAHSFEILMALWTGPGSHPRSHPRLTSYSYSPAPGDRAGPLSGRGVELGASIGLAEFIRIGVGAIGNSQNRSSGPEGRWLWLSRPW
jgi:hypothetical protein